MFRNQVKYCFERRIFRLVVSVLLIFLIAACQNERKPKEILNEREMVRVLTELYVMEEKVGRLAVTRDSVLKIFPKFEKKFFERMNISDSAFNKSMDYYREHPAKLEYIYTALVDSLSLRTLTVTDSTRTKNEVPQ